MDDALVFKILAYVFITAAFILYLLYKYTVSRIKNIIRSGTVATGVIIEKVCRAKGSYLIKYSYHWIDRDFEGKNYVKQEYFSRVSEGDHIPINVSEEKPGRSRIYNTEVFETLPMVLKILSIVFGILGVVYFAVTTILKTAQD